MKLNIKNGNFSGKKILFVTLSQLAVMSTHIIISMTDLWAAGQLDTTVQASIGVVAQILAMMVLVVSIVSGGTMATISQSLGAGNKLKAKRYANLVIVLVFGVGLITSLISYLLMPLWTAIFATDASIVKPFQTFATAYILYLPFFYTCIAINTVFRAHTFVLMPFATMSIIAVVNVAGDLLFGLGYLGFPKYGYHGIAYSTAAGALIGVIFNVFMLFRFKIVDTLLPPPMRWIKAALPYLLKVSIPSTIGQLAGTISSFTILAMLTNLPDGQIAATAGVVIGMRVESLILFPLGALAISLAMVSGHMMGAGKYDELYKLGIKISLIVASMSLVTAVTLFVFRDYVIGIFTVDEQVIIYASFFVMVACFILPLRSYAAVQVGILSGAGATAITSRISVITSLLIQLPMAYVLAYVLDYKVYGIYTAMLTSSIFSSTMLVIEYKRKKWLDYGMKKHTKK